MGNTTSEQDFVTADEVRRLISDSESSVKTSLYGALEEIEDKLSINYVKLKELVEKQESMISEVQTKLDELCDSSTEQSGIVNDITAQMEDLSNGLTIIKEAVERMHPSLVDDIMNSQIGK